MKNTVTPERIRELLDYSSDTGVFTWRVTRGGGAREKSVAGAYTRLGYIKIGIDRRYYFAHRLAWLYVYGEFPVLELDHVNRKRDDNRIANLRQVTRSANCQNTVSSGRSASGYRGVTLHRRTGQWRARISHNGKLVNLGLFETRDAAHVAYKCAAERLHTHNPVVGGAA